MILKARRCWLQALPSCTMPQHESIWKLEQRGFCNVRPFFFRVNTQPQVLAAVFQSQNTAD